jgi:division protein CdvB (Snf7/Vps24/ESCRT-III family)
MDIHPSQGSIHSFKDFLFHLLTVVIGILIALSLEGFLDWHHHRMLLQEARSNLASEIRENRKRITKGLARAPDAESRLRATIEAIDSYRKNHDDQASKLDWSFGLFPLNATAWSTAASTGAVSYMNYSEVQDYTRVYVVQEQFLSLQQRTLEKWLELQKWSVRITPGGGFSKLTNGELSEIEEEASAALIHTQTEESIAGSLVNEYSKVLQEK